MSIGPSVGFGVFGLLVVLIYIGLLGLGIYLMISTIQFFKRKTQNDEELLRKLDELIKMQSQK